MRSQANDEKNVFAKNLSRLISEKGITQVELGKQLGIGKTTINTWCTGYAVPSIEKMKKIADYFEISTSDLLNDDDEDDICNEFMKICTYFNMTNDEFCNIAIDYFQMPNEKKKSFCSFYKQFISSNKKKG